MMPETQTRPQYKITMKFLDKDDGNIDFSMKFEPELDMKGLMTPALKMAFDVREFLNRTAKELPRPGQKSESLIVPPTIDEIKDANQK